MKIRILLPYHLRTLAKVSGDEVEVEVSEPVTLGAALDALEAAYPSLLGTFRDLRSKQRRAFIRYYANREDLSHEPPETPLPSGVLGREEPLIVMGAMAGG